MAIKKGLGHGLNALIPTGMEEEQVNGNKAGKVAPVITEVVKEVEKTLKISQLEPNKSQPRRKFEEDPLQELTESIKQYGVLQPILVTKRDKYYEIIAGERRWRAARQAGLKEVPVIIRDYSDQEIVEIALIENIQRENLNPIEEALAYKRLIEEFHLKQDELADRVAKSRTSITNSMRLLRLSTPVQDMIIDDKLSNGHARALIPIEDEKLQIEIACKVFDESLSVRETEALVKKVLNAKPEKEKPTIKYEYLYKDTESRLKEILGSKVSIKAKSDEKGKIEIEYYSSLELDELIDKLNSLKRS